MQTRKQSLLESFLNVVTGFVVAWTVTVYLLPVYGYEVSTGEAWEITMVFTVVSVIRSYLWRRFFNGQTNKNRRRT